MRAEVCPSCGSTDLIHELRDPPQPTGAATPPRESFGHWIVCQACGQQWPADEPPGEDALAMKKPTDERARQKLVEAIDVLAASALPLEKRVVVAMSALVQLDAEHFSDPTYRAKFTAIRERMTALDGSQGRIGATAATMNEEQLLKVASTIVSLAAYYLLGLDQYD